MPPSNTISANVYGTLFARSVMQNLLTQRLRHTNAIRSIHTRFRNGPTGELRKKSLASPKRYPHSHRIMMAA
jgi:hypothetical protein